MTSPEADALLEENEELLTQISDLTQERDVLRGIVQHVNDGWQYHEPRTKFPDRRGVWWRFQDAAGNWTIAKDRRPEEELMSPKEQKAIYGSVVREESTSHES